MQHTLPSGTMASKDILDTFQTEAALDIDRHGIVECD